jgi:enoyl-CoA hydratase/carnithine racemase
VLLSEDRAGVRTLTLNRPDRKNAIHAQLWVELADALAAAARDDLRALVITGAGGAFCSGADISTSSFPIWRRDSRQAHPSPLRRARACSTTGAMRHCERRWPTRPGHSPAISQLQTQ